MDAKVFFLIIACAFAATLIAIAAGIPLAWISAKSKSPLVCTLRIAFMLPLILPPTIVAVFLMLVKGEPSVKKWLLANNLPPASPHYPLIWTLLVAALALPIVYALALTAFRGLNMTLSEMARVYGAAELLTALQCTKGGLVVAAIFAFMRALGELAILLAVVFPELFLSSRHENPPIGIVFFSTIIVTATSVVALMKSRCRR
jgi:molybdate transport system permease protein